MVICVKIIWMYSWQEEMQSFCPKILLLSSPVVATKCICTLWVLQSLWLFGSGFCMQSWFFQILHSVCLLAAWWSETYSGNQTIQKDWWFFQEDHYYKRYCAALLWWLWYPDREHLWFPSGSADSEKINIIYCSSNVLTVSDISSPHLPWEKHERPVPGKK